MDAAATGQTPTAHCLTAEELAELADGVAGDGLRRSAERHARSCSHCTEAWNALQPDHQRQPVSVRVRFPAPTRNLAWAAVAVTAALAIAAVCFRPHLGPQAPQPGVEVATTPRSLSTPTPTSGALKPDQEPAVTPSPAPQPAPTPEANVGPSRTAPAPRPARPRQHAPRHAPPPAGREPQTTTPEAPMLALTGASALVQRWHDSKGEPSRFSREDLEELQHALPQDRKVLQALVERLRKEGTEANDQAALEQARTLQKTLDALQDDETAPAPQTEPAAGPAQPEPNPPAAQDAPQEPAHQP
jgi:hypothetical protein